MDNPQPQRQELHSPERELVSHVRDALSALPAYFQTATRIEGLDGGEMFLTFLLLLRNLSNLLTIGAG